MRCTRCDRIAFEEVLAEDLDGRLVFGWCIQCVNEAGFRRVRTPPAPLKLKERTPIRRRFRHFFRSARRTIGKPRTEQASRRLAAMGIAGLMTAWALILAFVGGIKLIGPQDGKGPWLLVASGAMAIVSLIVWIVMIGQSGGYRILLKVVQVAGAIAAFGTLAWGLLLDRREQAAWIVAISLSAMGVSWGARALERRAIAPSRHQYRFLLDDETAEGSTWDERTR